MKNISIQWLSHLESEKEKKEFASYIKSSNNVLIRLSDIIKDKLKEREVFREEDYKNPSWAYLQADRNGYVRGLNDILNLLKGIDQ